MVAALGTPEARLSLAQLVAADPLPPPIQGEALDTTTPYDVTLGQSIGKKLAVSPTPVNPHLDCHPTGRFEAFFRDVPTLKPGIEPTDSEIANYTPLGCVTNPASACITMGLRRLAQLHFLFGAVAKSNPQLTLRLRSASFAEEAYRLVQRYQEGMPTEPDCAQGL
jgi:hypothetical protein